MRECYEEGVLQAFCDGELPRRESGAITAHLSECAACTSVVRELANAEDIISAAMEPEFQAAVPTERLRQRINAAIAGAQVSQEKNSWFASLSNLFAFRQPQWGFASLIAVIAFASIFGIAYRRHSSVVPVVQTTPHYEVATAANNNVANPPVDVSTPEVKNTDLKPAVAVKNIPRKPRRVVTSNASDPAVAKVKLLPGERTYLKTIAALDSTIKSEPDRPMRPELRAEYERNLALVDRALAAARNAAKKNPNDPDAADFVFAAYQSKVDLMNTVADARTFNRQQ